jgi:hypothetical protein
MRFCFYSGVEGGQHFAACINAGVKAVLASFLYLEKTDINLIKKRKQKNPQIKFLIDSGAHTFQSDKTKYGSWSLPDFEAYLARYVKWIRANKDVIESAVELDIDWIVGTPVVEGWQKRYFEPLLAEGIDTIFVWHKQRGLEGWEEMCSRFSYVGLPGEFSGEPDFNKYMAVAKRYTTKVHGFAATKLADLRDWPWYSTDSTSWKAAERFGTLIHWDERKQKLVTEPDKSQRAQYRKFFEQFGLNADAIIQDTDYREVTKYALISFRRMEEFYAQKYKDRINYYDLRLPHPKAVRLVSDKQVLRFWQLFRPATLFKQHESETRPVELRKYLAALSAVQHREEAWLTVNPDALKFLGVYFPKQITPKITDIGTFQKELAVYIAPPNPPPLRRSDESHFIPVNAPKARELEEVSVDDLVWDAEKDCAVWSDL